MKIKRFNENTNNNQIKEWIEDLLVPIVDSGFEYEITQGETSYKISFFNVIVPNMTKDLTDYTIFDRLSEFYGEMNGILTTLRKQFDVVVETSGSYIGVTLLKKGTPRLPSFMEIKGDDIIVYPLIAIRTLGRQVGIQEIRLDGDHRVEIELSEENDYVDGIYSYFRKYDIFEISDYANINSFTLETTIVLELKDENYKFKIDNTKR